MFFKKKDEETCKKGLVTRVGHSENKDAFACGNEAAGMADLCCASVGLIFTSCVLDQKEVLKGVRSVSGAPVIGCTSSAAICTNDGYFNSADGYTGIMSFGGNVTVGVAGHAKDKDAREMGRELAREAMKKAGKSCAPSYFFMTASPAEEEYYLKGIEDVIGRVPMFGGSAADNTVEGKWSIICNDEVFSDGCAVAFFYTDSYMKNLYTGEYKETGKYGVITEVRGDRTLVSIDGVPAVKKYCEWTGKKEEEVAGGNLLAATIFAPLGVKDPIGSVTAIRHPMAANEDLSMNIGAKLAVGTAVMLMEGTADSLVEANPNAIKKLDALMEEEAQSYFLVHCGGRRLGLQLEGAEERLYPAVKEYTKDKPFLMVFTFGEYGSSDHSANTVGGLSLSYTGFGK